MLCLVYLLLTLVAVEAGYAPNTQAQCPSNTKSLIREANDISSQEKDWLKQRHKKTEKLLLNFLDKVGLKLEASHLDDVNIGIAISGGGYRLMLVGGGEVAGLDLRVMGPLGGVLDLATYILALSGGSWLLHSMMAYDWPSVDKLKDKWEVDLNHALINKLANWLKLGWSVFTNDLEGALTNLNHWPQIKADTDAKRKAGFGVTLTDYWGRGLAYQMTPGPDYGANRTILDIRDYDSFKNHDMPFPLIIAVGRRPGTLVYNLNLTVVEMNPYEIGSFDTSLNSFSDIKYLGTQVDNGRFNQCTTGFDNLGYVAGTSLLLFNQYLQTLVCDDCNQLNFIFKWIAKKFLTYLSKNYQDVAEYSPNPFYNSEYAALSNITKNDTLYLIDGGLAGETIPLSSLMTKERKLDMVFAFDNGNDRENLFPLGEALVFTYQRQFGDQGKLTLCPYVPPPSTFLQHNFTARPVFFGCDAKNLTKLAKDDVIPPLVVYMANRPYNTMSNVTLYQLDYTNGQRDLLINNGFNVATRANGTFDDDWAQCVACAMIRRSQERHNTLQSDTCKKCFAKYCWDGLVAPDQPEYQAAVNFTELGLTNGTMMTLVNQPSVIKRLIEYANSVPPLTSSGAAIIAAVAVALLA